MLHVGVVTLASGCLIAAWWQATRALGGNSLSWFYSVEWPVFALLAIAGWWHLVHEDPDAYTARKGRPRYSPGGATANAAPRPSGADDLVDASVDPVTARWARALALVEAIVSLLGVMALFAVPVGRASGWLPAQGRVVYLAHASLGFLLALACVALVVRVKGKSRMSQVVAWLGLAGVSVAGIGGLLTAATSLVRFLGLALMFIGAVMAAFGYRVPGFLARSRPTDAASSAEAATHPG